MTEPPDDLDFAEYEALLRADFAVFVERCFVELNPQTDSATNWHYRVIAAKLTAVHEGRSRRVIINLPPRHLKGIGRRAAIARGMGEGRCRPVEIGSSFVR